MTDRPKKKPGRPRKPRPWTKAEDFYLAAHVGRVGLAAVAADLGRPLPEVDERVTALDLRARAEEAGRAERLKGFDTHACGAVGMTARQSFADDRRAGRAPDPAGDAPPPPPAPEPLGRYKDCVKKIF